MERCIRCEAEGRSSVIKGLPYRISVNGLTMVLCNTCYTEVQDEVGEITYFRAYNEDEED